MTAAEAMQRIDTLCSHVWMVRTFVKHAPEVEGDEELAEVHRELYDFMLALGGPLKENKGEEYLAMARRKLGKLKRATELFLQIQPQVSGHMNFQMAAQSLAAAVREIVAVLESTSA